MIGWHTQKKKRVLIVALGVCAIVLIIRIWNRPTTSHSRQVAAEEVVVQGIMAVRSLDGPQVLRLMHNRSFDVVVLSKNSKNLPKITKRIRDYFRLAEWPEPKVRAVVHTLPSVDRRLVESILATNFLPNWQSRFWDEMSPVVVLYRIDGRDMISIVVKDHGQWRLSGFPCAISARVLEYRDVHPANLNGDAMADDPVDPRIQNQTRRGRGSLD